MSASPQLTFADCCCTAYMKLDCPLLSVNGYAVKWIFFFTRLKILLNPVEKFHSREKKRHQTGTNYGILYR